ncbi:MAG: hypothetical protein P4L33_00650 [Capsulimonadaceae bacterium]|nr:hypothetical protein [Capsulimonadaceae bacterium]
MATAEVNATDRYASSVAKRYTDAYRVAKIFAFFGGFTKVLGFLIAALMVAAGCVSYNPNQTMAVAAVGVGIVVWISSFVAGMLISAQGQVLKANVDTAVNTSPFLSDSQRATTMSL